MATSYKDFNSFNQGLADLKQSAKSILIQRLLNINSTIPQSVVDLPQNWARGLSGVIQQEYDEDGHITDVTPTEAISTVDSQLYNALRELNQIKNQQDAVKSQLSNLMVNANISAASISQSDNVIDMTANYATVLYMGQFNHSAAGLTKAWLKVDPNAEAHDQRFKIYINNEPPLGYSPKLPICNFTMLENGIQIICGSYAIKWGDNDANVYPYVARREGVNLTDLWNVTFNLLFTDNFDMGTTHPAQYCNQSAAINYSQNDGYTMLSSGFDISGELSSTPEQYLGLMDIDDAITMVSGVINEG